MTNKIIKGFTLSCKSFRSNPLTALLCSRLSRFSLTKFRSRAAHVYGFTLAEVLITLSILGVVAAIAIPNIINNYQKQATVSRLKMAYSMLDRLTQQSYIENGYPPNEGNGYDIYNNFYNYYGKYLNIAKDCGIFAHSNKTKNYGCFKNNTFKNLNNNYFASGYDPSNYYQVLLKNGMSIGVLGNMSYTGVNHVPSGTVFAVDIDGPNRGDSKLGQDVFMFVSSKWCNNTGQLMMGGISGSQCNMPSRTTILNNCKEGANTNAWGNGQFVPGATCSTLIIMDGWKISSDYPWNYAHKK